MPRAPADRARVFVYGSLLSGEANHRELAGATLVGPAATSPVFTLVDLGPYPALLRGGVQSVKGELFLVDAGVLARLDAFEGHPELYTRATISLADGTSAEAYLFDRAKAEGCEIIASGDWRARRPVPR